MLFEVSDDAQEFYPMPLDGTLGSFIRLLRLKLVADDDAEIECSFTYADLDGEQPPYCALSFTWGSPERTRSVLLHGKRFGVTESLWSALHVARHHNKLPESLSGATAYMRK